MSTDAYILRVMGDKKLTSAQQSKAVIATLDNLPAGDYVVFAKADVVVPADVVATFQLQMSEDHDEDTVYARRSGVAATINLNLGGTVASTARTGKVALFGMCEKSCTLQDITITAIRVDTLTHVNVAGDAEPRVVTAAKA